MKLAYWTIATLAFGLLLAPPEVALAAGGAGCYRSVSPALTTATWASATPVAEDAPEDGGNTPQDEKPAEEPAPKAEEAPPDAEPGDEEPAPQQGAPPSEEPGDEQPAPGEDRPPAPPAEQPPAPPADQPPAPPAEEQPAETPEQPQPPPAGDKPSAPPPFPAGPFGGMAPPGGQPPGGPPKPPAAPEEPVEPAPPGEVTNGSFEKGLGGWRSEPPGGEDVRVDDGAAKSGKRALRLWAGRSGVNPFVTQDVKLIGQAALVTASLHARPTLARLARLVVRLEPLDAAGSVLRRHYLQRLLSDPRTWVELKGTVPVPPEADRLRLTLRLVGTGGLWVDDVETSVVPAPLLAAQRRVATVEGSGGKIVLDLLAAPEGEITARIGKGDPLPLTREGNRLSIELPERKPGRIVLDLTAAAPPPATAPAAPATGEKAEADGEAPAPATEASSPTTEAPAPATEASSPTTEAPAPTTEASSPTTEATSPKTEAEPPSGKAAGAPTPAAPTPVEARDQVEVWTAPESRRPRMLTERGWWDIGGKRVALSVILHAHPAEMQAIAEQGFTALEALAPSGRDAAVRFLRSLPRDSLPLIIPAPFSSAEPDRERAFKDFLDAVAGASGDRRVAGWIIADEPELRLESDTPDVYLRAKKVDGLHPMLVVIADTSEVGLWRHFSDGLVVNLASVGLNPVEVHRRVREVAATLEEWQPAGAILPVGWTPAEPPADPARLKLAAFAALAGGARLLGWYCLHTTGWDLQATPTWPAFRGIHDDLAKLTDLIGDLPFAEDVRFEAEGLVAAAWAKDATRVALLVNPGAEPREAILSAPEGLGQVKTVLGDAQPRTQSPSVQVTVPASSAIIFTLTVGPQVAGGEGTGEVAGGAGTQDEPATPPAATGSADQPAAKPDDAGQPSPKEAEEAEQTKDELKTEDQPSDQQPPAQPGEPPGDGAPDEGADQPSGQPGTRPQGEQPAQ